MTKKYSIVFFIFIYCLSLSGSQKSRLFAFIESLEENGMIQEVITEYRRYLFFNPLDEEARGKIWLRLALSYRKINREAEMMKAFNQSFRLLQNSPFLDNLYEEISVFFLSRGKSEWARLYLNKINQKKQDSRKIQYLILSYLMDENWAEFFPLLMTAGYKESDLNEIRTLVNKIKNNNRKFNLLKSIDKVIPGISHCFMGDVFDTGESLLFHFFFIQQIFVEPTVLGKLIYGFTLVRYYLKTTAFNRDLLKKKKRRIKLRLEEKIFHKLITASGF
ncbi:MAG: bacterial transcriptional activator domain-containing protein [Candidatus Aminicenantes bacterium]|nr:bacterial transcriptional activator domain-containing protein [Candidatus Aminicenantes bacterium]